MRCAGVNTRKGAGFNGAVLVLDMRSEARLAGSIEGMRGWCAELGVDYDAAGKVYREASGAGLTRGRPARVVQSAAIYVAARRSNTPLTLRQVVVATGVPLKNVRRTVNVLDGQLPPQDAMLYVEAGAGILGLPSGAVADLDGIRTDLGAPLRAAIALFAAAHACGSHRSVADVAEAVGVEVKNLRNYVRGAGELKPKARPGMEE